MKFINKVMVFVMGIVVLGVVATTIGVVTQSKTLKTVTFELLDNGTYSPNVFDKIIFYSVIDDELVTNIQLLKVNDIDETQGSYIRVTENISIYLHSGDGEDVFFDDGTYFIEDGVFQVGDVISITFEVEQETPVIIKTLIFLIPLVLSASLIGYLAFKKGDKLWKNF